MAALGLRTAASRALRRWLAFAAHKRLIIRVSEGTAREAAHGFPADLNVALALSLAGNRPNRARLEIWADPGVTRNIRTIELDSDVARQSMTIENFRSIIAKTGRITAQTVVAMVRKMRAPLAVGSQQRRPPTCNSRSLPATPNPARRHRRASRARRRQGRLGRQCT